MAPEGALPQIVLWDMVPQDRGPVPVERLVKAHLVRQAYARKCDVWCPCTRGSTTETNFPSFRTHIGK